MSLSSEQKAVIHELICEDFFYVARNVLGYDNSKTSKGILTGDRYGISAHGNHARMSRLFRSKSERIMLQSPRGSYKSTFAECYVIQKILENPNIRILYSMGTKDMAEKKLVAVRDQLERNPNIQAVYGSLKTKNWGLKSFTVKRPGLGIADPTFTAGSVGMNLTGSHFDLVILDDIVTDKTVTATGLAATEEYFRMVEPLLDPGGQLVDIGTRYADGDLHGYIEREMGEVFEILKIECGFNIVIDEESGQKTLVGEPEFEHLDKDTLYKKLLTMDTVAFSSQYLNRCLTDDHQLFQRKDFKVVPWQPWMTTMRGFIVTDTAVSDKEKACYSVLAFIAMDKMDRAYLMDLKVGKWAPAKTVRLLVDLYEKWSSKVCVNKVLMENIGLNRVFQTMIWTEATERQVGLKRITPIARGVGELSKDQRIKRLHMRLEDGNFFVVEGEECMPRYFSDGKQRKSLWNPTGYKSKDGTRLPSGELVDQFIRFPVARFNDIPDAIADIDGVDKNGGRLCRGAGGPSTSDHYDVPVPILGDRKSSRRGTSGGGKWGNLASRIKHYG